MALDDFPVEAPAFDPRRRTLSCSTRAAAAGLFRKIFLVDADEDGVALHCEWPPEPTFLDGQRLPHLPLAVALVQNEHLVGGAERDSFRVEVCDRPSARRGTDRRSR